MLYWIVDLSGMEWLEEMEFIEVSWLSLKKHALFSDSAIVAITLDMHSISLDTVHYSNIMAVLFPVYYLQ